MRVAVTGAAGYLGMNLLNRLIADGHRVAAIAHGVSSVADQRGVSWLEGDVLDLERMREVLTDVELVYHLVAKITLREEDPSAWRLNTLGVRTVAQAALDAGVRRLVHCSSVHAYDTFHPGELAESSPRSLADADLPVYDRSKCAGELELREIIEQGLDAVICNPTGVFGPVDHPAPFPNERHAAGCRARQDPRGCRRRLRLGRRPRCRPRPHPRRRAWADR